MVVCVAERDEPELVGDVENVVEVIDGLLDVEEIDVVTIQEQALGIWVAAFVQPALKTEGTGSAEFPPYKLQNEEAMDPWF